MGIICKFALVLLSMLSNQCLGFSILRRLKSEETQSTQRTLQSWRAVASDVDDKEILQLPNEAVTRSPLISSFVIQLKSMFNGRSHEGRLLDQIGQLMSLTDVIIMVALIFSYKPALKMIHKTVHAFSKERPSYEKSLLGYLEDPVKYLVYFPPFLYLADVIVLMIHFTGIDFHIKGNLPHLIFTIAALGITGSFVTRIKDWFFSRLRRTLLPSERDSATEQVTDELASAIIWAFFGAFGLEIITKELQVGIGSIFALGGIGSASFVLALRSSMENWIGGLLLKFQNKFRIGERVSLATDADAGTVEEISYLSTKLRKDDDSYITIPNAKFIQSEVVNWSRTPVRLFKTSVLIPSAKSDLLPTCIESIRRCLQDDVGVEAEHRELLVSATGFIEGNIIIEIQARLKGSNDQEVSVVRTQVVTKISKILNDLLSQSYKCEHE